MKATDVAVIGGGVVGVACARALQRAGRSVMLIEEYEVGRGCSFGNAGLIAIDHIQPLARLDVLRGTFRMLADPLGPLHVNWSALPSLVPWFARFAMAALPRTVERSTNILAALLRDAVPAWKRLLAGDGASAGLFKSQGYLTLFETEQSAVAAARENNLLSEHGIQFETLSPSEIVERVPALAKRMKAGRFHTDAAFVAEPFALVRHLARQFAADGGEVIEWQRVTGFVMENTAVRGVRLRDDEILTNRIVLAAGVGSKQLARELALDVPLVPERGYHVMVPYDVQVDTPLLFADRGFVATPMETGLRLAGTVELGAASPNWRRAEALRAQAAVLFDQPHLVGASHWHGDRPTLPDYLPIVGPTTNHPNIVLAFGHQHLGLTLAAITAELVTDVIQGRQSRLDIAGLSALRFGCSR